MRIVNVTTGDTGNQSYLLSQAINEHSRHKSRSFVRRTYFEWPFDVVWRPEWQGDVPSWIKNYWQTADVVHLHNKWQRAKYWAESPNAAYIVHQHGRWPDRDRYALELEVDQEREAIRVVSTPNLLPDVGWRLDRWFPRPMPMILPPKANWSYPPHIIQAPTVRSRKHTAVFLEVCEELGDRLEFTYEIVTQKPHSECIIRKARADILFDQLAPGYGTNALEAWALGIPAICGVSPQIDDFVRTNIVKHPPYVVARSKEELKQALERLILKTKYRSEMAKRGNEYVRKWHTPSVCARIAIATYKEALGYE